MAVTKAQQKAVSKYMKENYDVYQIRMPKGKKDTIKAHAEAGGFMHYPVSSDESYRHAIECIAAGLRAAGEARA